MIISLFQTLIYIDDIPKNYPSKFHQYTNQSVWKTIKTIFWESKTSLDRPIFPIKTIEYPSFGMVRIPRTIPKTSSPGPSHPPATVAAQNALPLQELPELGVWPRSAPHRVIRVFIKIIHIYIYIYLFIYIYIYM